MPLTLAEALHALPVLSTAQVVAGRKGLQRTIRWTHIVDQPEVFSWVREGDLLVTTAFALKDNLESELVMVSQMAKKGLAGMLVSIGRYIDAVPDKMIAEAETVGFPIAVIPWEVPLVEVTHAIHERIILEQYQLTDQAHHIQDFMQQQGQHTTCQVVVLEMQEAIPSQTAALVRTTEQMLIDLGLAGSVFEWGRRLLLIINATGEPSPEEFTGILVDGWSHRQGGCLIAGSSAPFDSPDKAQNAYQQAIQSLQAGLALGKGRSGVWTFERLGYINWLPSLTREMHGKNTYRIIIDEIVRYDHENGTNYLETLESYLNHHLNASQTSRELFIHRNSLLKRLNRSKELWTLDFEDPYFVLNLHLAIIDWRLNR